jgi:hypothetical protein
MDKWKNWVDRGQQFKKLQEEGENKYFVRKQTLRKFEIESKRGRFQISSSKRKNKRAVWHLD